MMPMTGLYIVIQLSLERLTVKDREWHKVLVAYS